MPSPSTKRRILVQAGHNKPLQPGHTKETGAGGEAVTRLLREHVPSPFDSLRSLRAGFTGLDHFAQLPRTYVG